MVDSWLDDNTANRHKQTYVKGFLDISGGDLILRNGQQYVEASYNYSTTDISDNSITSSQEITVNPVWSQLGNSITPTSISSSYSNDMSKDGTVIIVGEREALSNQGIARVFQYTNNVWTQLGVDLSGNNSSDKFGFSVSINADGSIIAMGTYGNGYCKVFEYDVAADGSWNQLGSDITGGTTAWFGSSLSLDASGHRLVVGDWDSGYGIIEVYDYDSAGNSWSIVGSRIDSPTTSDANFGVKVKLSGDGSTFLGGGNLYNNRQGLVAVYKYDDTVDGSWNQLGNILYGSSAGMELGEDASAINYDGSIVAMGEYYNDQAGTNRGKVYAYIYNTSTSSWDQLGEDIFGREDYSYLGLSSIDLTDDGTILAVTERDGVSANAGDRSTTTAAVGYVYKYTNGAWKLLGQPIEYYNPATTAYQNSGCCISNDGTIFSIVQQGDLRVFELSQITNYVSNPTYKTTTRTGNYSIRLGDVSNNDTALSITKNYTTVTHDISGTYSDSYTHYPLIGENTQPSPNDESTSYTQLGLEISIEMTNGVCRLDASGTRLMIGNNSGVNVYEYSHFTWTQLGSTIPLGGSNNSLYEAAISGNGEYVVLTASSNDYSYFIYKYNSSANAWESYGSVSITDSLQAGSRVDIAYDGQTIIVGEIYFQITSTRDGRARVFEYTGDGTTHSWSQVGGFIMLDWGTQEDNGYSVGINKTGNIIAVSSPGYDGAATDTGRVQVFKYKSGVVAGEYTHGYKYHDDWEPLGNAIEGVSTYDLYGAAVRMNDDGYTILFSGGNQDRFLRMMRYSEELGDWYQYGYAQSEDGNLYADYYAAGQKYVEISGDGEMALVSAFDYGYGMARQYKVLNGKLEPVGPAIYGVQNVFDNVEFMGMSSDGKIIAIGARDTDQVRVYQLNDVQQTITAHTYKNTETETQDYIHLGNKTTGNMLEIKGTSEITGDMTINSTGTYQYIDISHVPQSIVLMDENEVYHTDVSYNGALSGYYCAALSSVYTSSTNYDANESFNTLIGQYSPNGYRATSSDPTYSSGTYVGSVITSYKESKTDATYTDLSGEYLQIEFPFMIKPNEFNYMHDHLYHRSGNTATNITDISYAMAVGWDGTEWLKLTDIKLSDGNRYGMTYYDLSSNTHYINKLRIIAHESASYSHVGFGAPYLSGTIRTGTVPSMAITSTDTDIKFNVTDLSMAGNLTIEANTFTLKNKDLNTDSDVNLIKYFPQAVAGNYQMSRGSGGDDHMYSSNSSPGLWMANIIHHTGSNSHFNGGYLIEQSDMWEIAYAGCDPFLYHTDNAYRFSARHFMEQTHTYSSISGWLTTGSRYDATTGAYKYTTTTTFVDINGNTHNVGGEYLELHTPLPMKYKKFHYLSHHDTWEATQKIMFVGKKNDIYYQLSYPQTLLKDRFYNDVELDRTDIFVSSIRIIVLEVYDGYSTSNPGFISQLSFDAIPSIDTHLEITNNQFGTVFNAYDKGAKGNIILNEAPHFNESYLQYEQVNAWYDSTTSSSKLLSNPTGYVGIGTNKPVAPLTVYGYGGFNSYKDDGFMLMYSGSQIQFDNTVAVSLTDATIASGLYSIYSIRSMSYIVANGGIMLASDERIKKNVKDIDDGEALGILRTLKPKTYEYINKINRNETGHVYGFMAQDVSAAIPYSVKIEREYVPNIYELADISNGNIVLTKNTTDAFTKVPELDASGNAMQDASGNTIYRLKNKTLKCMTLLEADFEVTIKEIIDENRFTIKESLTLEQTTHVDISGNPLKNKLFVLGEVVDDFHVLNKEAIWTISTAALQEIDRSVQAEETSTQTMEAQIAALLADVEALENA